MVSGRPGRPCCCRDRPVATAAGAMRRSVAALALLSVTLLVGFAGTRAEEDLGATRNPMVGINYHTGDGMYTNESQTKQVLLQYGMAEATVSYLFRPSTARETVTSATVNVARKHIITNRPTVEQAEAGTFAGVPLTNMTFTLAMEGQVGVSAYTLVVVTDVDTYSMEGSYEVVLDGSCSSAGYADGKLSDGCGAGFASDGSAFALKLSPYRIGTGSFKLTFKWTSLELDGEYFTTELIVKLDTTMAAPCVAMGGEVEVDARGGSVAVDMFNLMMPPQGSDVEKVVLSYGGKSYDHDPSKSVLEQPDQKIVFSVGSGVAGESYDAKLQCVFEDRTKDAKYLGGKLRISVTGKAELAAIAPLAEMDNKTRVAILIELDRYEPESYTVAVHNKCVAALVQLLGVSASNVGLGAVTPGSAIAEMHVYADDRAMFESQKRTMTASMSPQSCDAAEAIGEPCDTVSLKDMFVLASDGSGVLGGSPVGTVAASGTLAAWSIALIAVLGALVVLVLVCLALWVVYRRSSDSSASDYSSSGPLGVPDPDDLLYNESVVRDVYGRSNGAGPTAEAAAERAREAELREEFPRPPSTSAASGRDTDDASSTYTV
ncbi:hypothetical protein I4F81_008275 [Pyropia yezoensis]|uniref:Uncharacterized protein n=1 Tax=Pyropia yezoensis TaxID=2788 RepID=A0ACC3C701_PYRYE|nr:hypothetical protein I4F81_008275 [Neopyropia yezoensis]